MAFVFGLQTLQSIDSSKIYQLKGLKPKNKDHTNFAECCDLMEKVYLISIYDIVEISTLIIQNQSPTTEQYSSNISLHVSYLLHYFTILISKILMTRLDWSIEVM